MGQEGRSRRTVKCFEILAKPRFAPALSFAGISVARLRPVDQVLNAQGRACSGRFFFHKALIYDIFLIGYSKAGITMARGGKRPGAGRPKGSLNKVSSQNKTDLRGLARSYTDIALEALADVAENGDSEGARVSAAVALLDRGYGRPTAMAEAGPTREAYWAGIAEDLRQRQVEMAPIASAHSCKR